MAKSQSTKFFGAAGTYNNFNSTAFAQQLTDTLSGTNTGQQAQVSNTNVVDQAAEQAGQQIDALAQATKAGLTRQIATVTTAAGGSKPAPQIVTTATLTATTTATPQKNADGTAAASTTTSTGDTAATATETSASGTTTGTTTTEKAATDSEIDSGKFDVPGSDEDIKASTTTAVVVPPVVVAPVVVAPVDTGYSTGTYVLIVIGVLLLLAIIAMVGYMLYYKKSASEAIDALKKNLSNVFGKAPTTTAASVVVK